MTAGVAGLDPCTHGGFCLPACPTSIATSDDLASPCGRIMLRRGPADGELAAGDTALLQHPASCTLCAAGEPAGPPGVRSVAAWRAAQHRLAEAAMRLVPAEGVCRNDR